MKRIVPGLLLLSLGLTGCFPMDYLRPTPVSPLVVVAEEVPPIVTEDQVNQENAVGCAKALRTELEYEKLRRVGGQPRE